MGAGLNPAGPQGWGSTPPPSALGEYSGCGARPAWNAVRPKGRGSTPLLSALEGEVVVEPPLLRKQMARKGGVRLVRLPPWRVNWLWSQARLLPGACRKAWCSIRPLSALAPREGTQHGLLNRAFQVRVLGGALLLAVHDLLLCYNQERRQETLVSLLSWS